MILVLETLVLSATFLSYAHCKQTHDYLRTRSTGATAIPSRNDQDVAQPRALSKLLKSKFITFARNGFQEHNNFRALHHVPPLKWSDELATQAQKLAYRMALKGTIQVPGLDLFGENRAKLSAVDFDCESAGEEAAKIWYNQGNNYSYADPRLNSNTDSFTQVVWKETRNIGMGCAQRKNALSNEIFVVALYYPPGNIPRSLRQNVVSPSKNVNDAYSTIFRRRNQMYKVKPLPLLQHKENSTERASKKRDLRSPRTNIQA